MPTPEECDKARRRYDPREVRRPVDVLFVAESPPSSGGFFYFDTIKGKSWLFKETMKAIRFCEEDQRMPKGFYKVPWLKRFQRERYYLIDVCKEPVDDLESSERTVRLREAVEDVVGRVQQIDPKRIIIVKSPLFDIVAPEIRRHGLGDRILNNGPLPFPCCGHQGQYRQEVRRLLGVA